MNLDDVWRFPSVLVQPKIDVWLFNKKQKIHIPNLKAD